MTKNIYKNLYPNFRKYDHLIKPLVVRDGPEGLYPEPQIWGGGKEWEDYNGHFSYGFLKKVGEVVHPMEGAVVHPYDEILVCAGMYFEDIQKLGGEMSIEIGKEREEYIFNTSEVICIPKGTPHGALKVRKIDSKPIVHFLFGLAPEYKAETIPEKSWGRKTTGKKHAHMVKLLAAAKQDMATTLAEFRKTFKPEDIKKFEEMFAKIAKERGIDSSGMGYEAITDKKGVMRPGGITGPGNADQLVWMYGKDLDGFDFNFAWGFYSHTGLWHRMWEGHTHPETEALIFVGLKPDDLNYLGAELQFQLGVEFEPYIYNKPTSVIAPGGFVHLPLVTRWVDDTYGFMVACLSGSHEAPGVQPEDLY